MKKLLSLFIAIMLIGSVVPLSVLTSGAETARSGTIRKRKLKE